MEILIVGGIAAGASIAAKAKRTNPDANVTIIEKEDYVSFGACGLPYYIGGQFDNSERMFARSVEKTRETGVEVLVKHEALSVDFDKKEVTIKNLENNEELVKKYDKLAIATGAIPLVFGEGSDAENVITVTKLREADQIKEELKNAKDVVVVGSGFIGLEVAEQIKSLGKNVKVVQRAKYLMDNVFDTDISELIKEALVEHGVEFLEEHSYEKFEVENNRAKKVITDKGEYECDLAIMAVGFKPNTEIFTDERLNKLKNGAIVIDRAGRTSIKDVYAAGDCATVYNPQQEDFYAALATYANKMGRIIGENIVSDEQQEYLGAYGSSSLQVGEYGVGATGLTESRAKSLNLDVKSKLIKTKNQTSYVKGQEDLYIKLVYERETGKIVGGQVFGKKGAVERLTAISVAVYAGITVDELGFIDFAYSPPFAPTWDGLNVAGNAAK